MKYRLIIADDEPIICRGLASFHWEQLGFTVCGTATDGKECLRLMELSPADVIITDIQMPIMDGLELAQLLHQKYPACKVILLTGHKKFEYAQAALKAAVADYLIKPVDLDELEALMKKLKQQLDEEHMRNSRLEDMQNKLEKAMPSAIEKFIRQLVSSPLCDMNEIEETMSLLEINFPFSYYVCLIIQFSHLDSDFDFPQIILSLLDFIDSRNRNYVRIMFFHDEESNLILLVNFTLPDYIKTTYSYIRSLVSELFSRLSLLLTKDGALNIGVGNIYSSIASCHSSYQQALRMLTKQFFETGSSCFYAWNEKSVLEDILIEYPYRTEDSLIDAILIGNKEDAFIYLEDFFNVLIQNKKYLNHAQAVHFYQQFFLILKRRMDNLNISLPRIIGEEPPFAEFLQSFSNIFTLKQGVHAIVEKAMEQIDTFNRSCNTSAHFAISQALDYIHQHYAEKLTLNQVADYVHLNPSYFSLQFKNELGKNFIHVLKEYRIQKATELLKDPKYKVYEISRLVGYQNPNYFTDAFKLLTGMSPLEYRKKL